MIGAGANTADAQSMKKAPCAKDARQGAAAFRRALRNWFSTNGKSYPWRETRDPYAIWVSEVMLQQTQIATVLGKGYYTRFLEKFPNISCLATAEDDELLKAWEGLGYYRRARLMRETAREVMTRHAGIFPNKYEDLIALPGIGRYTAGALLAFAFGKPAALVDGNIARVLSRVMDFQQPIDDASGTKKIWEWAEILSDRLHPRIYHSALMELGQLICKPSQPNCGACPVAKFCLTQDPRFLPKKRARPVVTQVTEHALWVRNLDGKLLLHQESNRRRQGLWKLPIREADELSDWPILTECHYAITRYRVHLMVHEPLRQMSDFDLRSGESFHSADEALALAMPSPFRRVVEKLLSRC